ncbi:hypothetical protein X975_17888, partial [Stegodyphus mimosarum]
MIEDHCLCLLNNGQNTYFHEPTRTFRAVHLTICSPSLLPFSTFSVGNYPYSSDHFPILVSITRDRKNPMSRAPRFILTRADWELFSSLAEITEEMVKNVSIDDAVKECHYSFTDVIIQAATVFIPKTSKKLPKYSKPWWNHECQDTLKQQRKKHPTVSNLIAFEKAKAIARRVRRKSQRDTWVSYVSGIISSMSSKRVWEKVRKDFTKTTLSFLEKDGRVISATKKLRTQLARILLRFLVTATTRWQFFLSTIQFNSPISEPYNVEFTLCELRTVLMRKHRSSSGLDSVNYEMLKHLPWNFPPRVSGSLYVDDLQINCYGADMRCVERQLQIAINGIQK